MFTLLHAALKVLNFFTFGFANTAIMGLNATVPGTPTTLDGMNSTALRKTAWDNKLRVDSVRPSVLTELKTEFQINDVGEIIITKPGLMLDVTNVGKGQRGQSVYLALRTPLKKRARYGTGENMLGNEDETELLWTRAFYNEIKKAVKFNQWGYFFNDTEYLNYNAGYNPLLSQFHMENDDSRMHQSLLLTYAEELTFTPVSAARQFNKNWVIPNLVESSYPAYDTDALTVNSGSADSDLYFSNRTYSGATTFVENIAAALLDASGTGATSLATLTVDNLAQVYNYVIDNHLVEPIMLDGVPSYIFMVGTRVKSWMMNPNNTGSMGEHIQAIGDYKVKDRLTITGEFGRIYDSFVMVHDPRYCTLKVNGAAGSYNLEPGFLQPGNNDDRNRNAWANTSGSTNYSFDINFILGANALMRYRRDDLKMGLSETTEYGKIKGSGTYKGEGIQIPAFDKDAGSQSVTSQIQRGSAVVPMSRVNVAQVT